MTAIARYYVSDGFVLATDGLIRDSVTRKGIVTDAQKLFQAGTSKIGYAFCGAHRLGSPEDCYFDFREEIGRSIEQHSIEVANSLSEYVRTICGIVLDSLKDKAARLTFPADIDNIPGTIVHITFDGYIDSGAESVTVRFSQKDGIVRELEVMSEPLDQLSMFGSAVVFQELERKNPKFTKYATRVPAVSRPLSSELEKAMSRALTYIAACSSEEARSIDPGCDGIGGSVGMAVIRPKTGFRWVPGFKPATASYPSGS